MCGRYSFFSKDDIVEDRWQAKFKLPIKRHFNAAPSQILPVILNDDPQTITAGKWGLVTPWMIKAKMHPLINARVETVTKKPSFKNAAQKRRCLVLADNFFEWNRHLKQKVPYRIFLKNEEPFAFAGIWEMLKLSTGLQIPTFSIITTPPNGLISQLHDRMPAILKHQDEQLWIDTETALDEAVAVLQPFPSNQMKMYEVSRTVNSVRNDVPGVIRPVQKLV